MGPLKKERDLVSFHPSKNRHVVFLPTELQRVTVGHTTMPNENVGPVAWTGEKEGSPFILRAIYLKGGDDLAPETGS